MHNFLPLLVPSPTTYTSLDRALLSDHSRQLKEEAPPKSSQWGGLGNFFIWRKLKLKRSLPLGGDLEGAFQKVGRLFSNQPLS
jgi:hypothetical protein